MKQVNDKPRVSEIIFISEWRTEKKVIRLSEQIVKSLYHLPF